MDTGTIAEGKLLITVPEFAAALGVSEAKAWAMVAGGDIPTLKVGRSRRIRVRDAVAFVDALGYAA